MMFLFSVYLLFPCSSSCSLKLACLWLPSFHFISIPPPNFCLVRDCELKIRQSKVWNLYWQSDGPQMSELWLLCWEKSVGRNRRISNMNNVKAIKKPHTNFWLIWISSSTIVKYEIHQESEQKSIRQKWFYRLYFHDCTRHL